MKTIILVIVIGIVMALAISLMDSGVEYKYEKEVTEVTNIPEKPESWQTDEDAIKAAKDVIKRKELQAELKALDAEIAEKTAKRKEVAKELDSY